MKKVALYCRVSTRGQEKEQTVETQILKLKEYCKEKKYKIVKIYKDVISGAKISRPALDLLREEAKKRLFGIICVYDMGRLSRKLGHQIALVDEFEKEAGVEVISIKEKFENTPEGDLFRNIKGSFYEYERFKIAQRSLDGKMRMLKEGKLVGCIPRYGYDYFRKTKTEDAQFKINPIEAKNVRLIFNDYLITNSITKTTKNIYERGVKNRKGTAFHKTTVRKLMLGEVYIGNFQYKGFKIKVPAIMDKQIFNRVQRMIKKNRREYLRPAKHFYLCQGLIRCKLCGRRYTTSILKPRGKLYLNYRCPQTYRDKIDEPPCRSRTIGVNKLDKIVWDYLVPLITDKKKVKEAIKLSQQKNIKDKSFFRRAYNSLIIEKGKAKERKMRILDLYADGNIDKKDLDKKTQQFLSQETYLEDQIKEIKKEIDRINNLNSLEKEIERLTLQYGRIVKKANKEQENELRKYIVRKWVKEINVLADGSIAIRVALPSPDGVSTKMKFPLSVPKPAYVLEDTLYREYLQDYYQKILSLSHRKTLKLLELGVTL